MILAFKDAPHLEADAVRNEMVNTSLFKKRFRTAISLGTLPKEKIGAGDLADCVHVVGSC
jgi:hypothetical protein